jgi:limonene 1,2-monooxygenase
MALMTAPVRLGNFIVPFHAVDENPTLCFERDLELVQWMDRLGYHEAWIGEHHSGAYETIASPELFIMAAAERTRHIRLGTGVSSLPYHNPLMLAERINQLDHLTRGRAMFGVGPGSLSSDAHMLGVPVSEARQRMEEALDVIVRLFRGEVVTQKGAWYDLVDARLHLRPYSYPHIEMAVANAVSPAGVRAAGKYGFGVLSLSATSAAGFNALASQWTIANECATEVGTRMDREKWRLVGPMHIAETREQALKDLEFGFPTWLHYMTEVANLPLVPPGGDPLRAMMDSGLAVVGTPDDAVSRIEQLREQSGGFGAFLIMDNNWASWEAKKKSYEMIARYVMPRINGSNVSRQASMDWVEQNNDSFGKQFMQAVGDSIERHISEKGSGNINPTIVANLGIDKKKVAKGGPRDRSSK